MSDSYTNCTLKHILLNKNHDNKGSKIENHMNYEFIISGMSIEFGQYWYINGAQGSSNKQKRMTLK